MRTFGNDVGSIRVSPGETFALELPAMATAGFLWVCRAVPAELEKAGDSIAPAGEAVGASSLQRFEFRALRAGKATLELTYGQPWGEPESTKRIEVEVRAAR